MKKSLQTSAGQADPSKKSAQSRPKRAVAPGKAASPLSPRKTAGKKQPATQSGRELVYRYIQKQMKAGVLLPGSVLDLSRISETLGISNTPLRDSLIRLEAEGYLTIFPRSKVVINTLELEDFPFLYEIMGALEYTTISSSIGLYTPEIIGRMKEMNLGMREAVNAGDMTRYDAIHYAFHEIFFQVSSNTFAERILHPIKNRLWDFPRKNFAIGWYHAAIDEHEWIVDAIEKRDLAALMLNIKELHWGFAHNEAYIRKTYNF